MDQGAIHGVRRRLAAPRNAAALAAVVSSVLAAVPGSASASRGRDLVAPVATTGGALSVTATSAELNGVVDAGFPLAAWFFQYSSSPTFSAASLATPTVTAGPGLHAVSALVQHLSPGTVYYFRLGVVYVPALGLPQTGTLGSVDSFRTPEAVGVPGFTSAGAFTVHVRDGAAAIPVRCTGAAGATCAGRVLLSLGTRRPMVCGAGTVEVAAPARQLVPVPLRRRCASLLAGAKRGSLAATLVLSSRSRSVTRRVTLAR